MRSSRDLETLWSSSDLVSTLLFALFSCPSIGINHLLPLHHHHTGLWLLASLIGCRVRGKEECIVATHSYTSVSEGKERERSRKNNIINAMLDQDFFLELDVVCALMRRHVRTLLFFTHSCVMRTERHDNQRQVL